MPSSRSPGSAAAPDAPSPSASFLAAYDGFLAERWPPGTTTARIPTRYGATHVTSHGPADATAPSVVLLPGGGATSAVWHAQAAHLGRTRRVHALDLIGEPGRSTPGERPIRTVADLTGWLDAVLAALCPEADGGRPVLAGHSYGAWIALHHALHAGPRQLAGLVLVDPTQCFTGFRPGYLLRAVPLLLRPTPRRARAFLTWETAGAGLDPDWLRLYEEGVRLPSASPVTGPRPRPPALRGLAVPTLVLLAEQGRALDPVRTAQAVDRMLPDASTYTIPGATHHTLPLDAPAAAEINRRLDAFLAAIPGD
ncbi:alpha/beta fold hydrolase [Streptomyces sp. C11-1]|uniref:Alpha/beta fold hydrolase n=1 Tax=Streptomyces durocortorensis TaxID=2811104 RepID=A0ABY9VRW2_9ACTN|nr:alpha/beta fold hydrolase [Streptomyces durocortorensis]WNF26679.1 alpha/beta fold hydrolase [Streptomyces durocortorensis]